MIAGSGSVITAVIMPMQTVKFTLRLIASTLIGIALHIGVSVLAAFALSIATNELAGDVLVLIFCIYLPFAVAGSIMGFTRGLALPVLAAVLSSACVIAIVIMSAGKVLAVPAIAISGLAAYCFQAANVRRKAKSEPSLSA